MVRSLGLLGQCVANVPIPKRQRGFNSGHQVESLILLQAAGGDCMDDMELLRQDEGLTKMLGYQVPGPGCVRDFIELFHDPEHIKRAVAEAQRQQRLAFIPEETELLEGLGKVLQGNVQAIARHHPEWTVATVDQDATISESHKRTAKMRP